MRNVYLAKKAGAVVYHTDLEAMKQLDGIEKPEMTISEADFEAAGSLARIINGKIVIGKTDAEKAAEVERASLVAEECALQKELAEKDYRVIKAAESGQALATLDPSLHQSRQAARTRIDEIRTRLAALDSAA
jgi:fumarylacetoacetate (FAA) hydrolase family protein